MHTVTIGEAQSQLPKLMEEALQGEEVIILGDNAPSVKLVPITRPGFGSYKGQIIMAEDFDAPLEDFAEYMP